MNTYVDLFAKVWSTPGGACLVRSGELFNTGNSGNAGTPSHIPESVLLEAIRKTHPAKSPSKLLPLSIPSLRSAFKKLTNLCTPNTMTDFWVSFFLCVNNKILWFFNVSFDF